MKKPETDNPTPLSTSPSFAPTEQGYYGEFGGCFAPEILIPALQELDQAFSAARVDPAFTAELLSTLQTFVGRPTPLRYCKNLTSLLGGAQIYIKNEGAAHTGAHKINHCVGQGLLTKRMGKKRIIAETGAGQHGVATAAVSAALGLECIVYMGARDVDRQRPNVFWMELLGAKVIPVASGGARLKDAVSAAMKDWLESVSYSHYLLGSALGPHPFPEMNRFFQSVVGQEIRAQLMEARGKGPDYVIACVGGGSNALGAFDAFLEDPTVQLVGVEAGGDGSFLPGTHASRFTAGRMGVVEGYKSIWMVDEWGNLADTHSIAAGLDYPGIGPLHAELKAQGRVQYVTATDDEVIQAIKLLAQREGIISALESAHGVAHAIKLAPNLSPEMTIVINLSGRGDKDLFILAEHLGDDGGPHRNFMEFVAAYSARHSAGYSAGLTGKCEDREAANGSGTGAAETARKEIL